MWLASSQLPAPAEAPADLADVALLVAAIAATAVVTIAMYQLVGLPFVRQLTTRRRGKPTKP
jgi:hypothetical protein